MLNNKPSNKTKIMKQDHPEPSFADFHRVMDWLAPFIFILIGTTALILKISIHDWGYYLLISAFWSFWGTLAGWVISLRIAKKNSES